MESVRLRPGREKSLERRHPWIFSGAVADALASLAPGQTVAVCAADGKTLGYGSYSPDSNIRVRMLSFDAQTVPDAAFVESLVAASCARRSPSAAATRLINAV